MGKHVLGTSEATLSRNAFLCCGARDAVRNGGRLEESWLEERRHFVILRVWSVLSSGMLTGVIGLTMCMPYAGNCSESYFGRALATPCPEDSIS